MIQPLIDFLAMLEKTTILTAVMFFVISFLSTIISIRYAHHMLVMDLRKRTNEEVQDITTQLEKKLDVNLSNGVKS